MKSMPSSKLLVALLVIGIVAASSGVYLQLMQPPTKGYQDLFPPMLSKDFYPNDLTREKLLARLPEAVRKTGTIDHDESWQGVIRITGDLKVQQGVTLTIKPGTIVLVAAKSDDQQSGVPAPKDDFNPKDPVRDEVYVNSRVEVFNDGRILAVGTRAQPIIITSDASNPLSDDWVGINTNEGGELEFQRVLIEYFRIFGISSSRVTVRQSILRNMLETVVIMGQGENLLTINPTITQSYLYNAGHHVVTIRSGSPVITHNVIRARPDLEFPGFEYGAIGCDFFSKPVIEHNFVEGGPQILYDGYVHGTYYGKLDPHGAVLGSGFGASVTYNTFYGSSGVGLEAFCSKSGTVEKPWTVESNNFLGNGVNLRLFERFTAEPADVWQLQLLRDYPVTTLGNITLPNNYWGTRDEAQAKGSVAAHQNAQVDLKPFKTDFISEALPGWEDFRWD